jgi:tetratricopeptide (TPR) repeat protein
MKRLTRFAPIAALLLVPTFATAQAKLVEAFELERNGRFLEAARTYREALNDQPASLPALLGLERVSEPIDQQDSVLRYVMLALEQAPGNRFIRSVELRAWATAGNSDSLAAAAARWIDQEPDSPDPYREWAFAVSQRGDLIEAQRILTMGGERLGNSSLARELAQLWVVTGEWVRAAQYWADASRADPGQASTAALSLARTNLQNRDDVINVLIRGEERDPAQLVAANLLAVWNRPVEGWVLLDRALPEDPAMALGILRGFVDRVRRLRGPRSAKSRGLALQRIAELTTGSFSENARLEAARAFAEAGDREIAEQLLGEITVDSTVVTPSQAGAMASLIGVMAASGRVDEAEGRFNQWSDRLLISDVSGLRISLAWAWVLKDSLDRAESIVESDSSISVMDTRGWISLFRGHVKGATEMFRAAGPLVGTREESTRRTGMMALLQVIGRDTVPEFGVAMLALHRGDTAVAVEGLQEAAAQLRNDGGRAEILSFAGRLSYEARDFESSQGLLELSVQIAPNGPTAPLSNFTLARTFLDTGRREEGIEQLENVIINSPNSAVVPRARRLLDQVRRAIPPS